MAAPAPVVAASVAAERSNAVLSVASRVKDYGAEVFKLRRPWTEVVDRTSFSKPANFAEATSRLRKNVQYFKVNYLVVVLLLLVVTFLTNPQALLVMSVLLAGWGYMFVVRSTPLVIGGRPISEREKFLGMSILSFITVFFLTNVGAVVFTSLMISCSLVAVHGSFRVPDDLFVDEGDASQGFLSIFGSPAAQTGSINV